MAPSDIRAFAKNEWLAAFDKVGRPSQYNENFVGLITSRESVAGGEVAEHLQPWLHILEDSIQWLANLAGILDRMNSERKLDAAQMSIWALLGASCAHAVAVRRLVLAGLDTTARATVRVLDEHLCACLTFLHNRELAAEFHQCADDNTAAEFWYKHLNTRALKKHLNAIERSIGLDLGFSQDMRAWREREIDSFSQAIHPSYLGSAFSTVTMSAADPDQFGSAFLGMASVNSERTLNFACKSIWYFCCFGFLMLFNEHGSRPPVIQFDEEDEMHQMAVVGRQVLQLLNHQYWEYECYEKS